MPLTKAQKRKVLYKAAELIAKGDEVHTCVAIQRASFDDSPSLTEGLVAEYGQFYGMRADNYWYFADEFIPEERRSRRILMILLFAEAGI